VSAGKNTYTYDAHTYHTKVPPQGIAELLQHYLPDGGLVLDVFSGSGMTGVAASALGYDSILNELSPAGCFIASRFVSSVKPDLFSAGVNAVLDDLKDLREKLYTTHCRECGESTELLYTVWSYRVLCPQCEKEFNLWDVCRRYGRTVREHKILAEFECPGCSAQLKKRTLQRTSSEPVEVAYKCCGSRQRESTAAPDDFDRSLVSELSCKAPLIYGYFPNLTLPDGVNLAQPRKHGLDSVDKFYTPRALTALSHIWKNVHRVEDAQLAGQLAFVFTSLYRRVTRLSEFRFWGGSGNTARLNIPFIFEESNVFISFARKARTIEDHLRTTGRHLTGRTAVVEQSATQLDYLSDNSVDIVFTDPPFGANINYSEMNLLWESWLGRFTDPKTEAIINRVQGKKIQDYEKLMCASLSEAYRVLRPGHWMLLVFMNSSASVWESLRTAIDAAGFIIVTADVFDKEHGTFKHFVSENTAGADLVLHCLKPKSPEMRFSRNREISIDEFLEFVDFDRYLQPYLHVERATEYDLRRVYSEWIAQTVTGGGLLLDFAQFRKNVERIIEIRRENGLKAVS
jgi:DNA modification methylase